MTLGTFDGVHLGHQKILKQLVEKAKYHNTQSILVTFDKHPKFTLQKSYNAVFLLTTPEERRAIFEQMGIDYLYCITFNENIALMPADVFVKNVFVQKLNVGEVIIGYDHRFGHQGTGNIALLEKMGDAHDFSVEEIDAETVHENTISSTKIRNFIDEGNVFAANKFLGYNFSLRGTVKEGKKIGNSIGFPTANIEVKNKLKIVPANGVYAVNVEVDGKIYGGMMNIGLRPTVNGNNHAIEAHIFDFNKNIYKKEITVYFVKKLRDERKFPNLAGLREQLEHDRIESKTILSETTDFKVYPYH